jgi:hypothetical protein
MHVFSLDAKENEDRGNRGPGPELPSKTGQRVGDGPWQNQDFSISSWRKLFCAVA